MADTIYMTASELIDEKAYNGKDFTFEGQTKVDEEGNYETEWLLGDDQLVRVKQNIYGCVTSLEK